MLRLNHLLAKLSPRELLRSKLQEGIPDYPKSKPTKRSFHRASLSSEGKGLSLVSDFVTLVARGLCKTSFTLRHPGCSWISTADVGDDWCYLNLSLN